jgi:hypothetical protein
MHVYMYKDRRTLLRTPSNDTCIHTQIHPHMISHTQESMQDISRFMGSGQSSSALSGASEPLPMRAGLHTAHSMLCIEVEMKASQPDWIIRSGTDFVAFISCIVSERRV